MKFTSRDGILFGTFMLAFGIYSIVEKGLRFDGEGWGDIAAVIAGAVVLGLSLLYYAKRKKGNKKPPEQS